MSNDDKTSCTFRVTVPVNEPTGPCTRAVDVKGTTYEVADGALHISGDEVGVFADGKWMYAHGVLSNETKENQ